MEPRPGAALTGAMVVLTLTTGMVEAVSFLVLGPVFTAVQTGNLLLLGFAVAGEGGLSLAAPALSLGGFAVGAVLGARLESSLEPRGPLRFPGGWFSGGLAAEAALLTVAGLAALRPGAHGAVTVLVATAMGLRNVTTLRAGVPDLTTTVATRSLTGLLAPLGRDSRISADTAGRLRRTAAVAAMFAGGLLGAWLLREGAAASALLFAVAATVPAAAAAHALLRRRENRVPGPGPTH
ncbi:YoaK family protein [Streptomyces sp. NPDC014894]|uniref:YoaK family protein n=1 Tax=Streptomyces sp. NPDC014894 TaxID=3364931 RepID=UPI0036FEBABB